MSRRKKHIHVQPVFDEGYEIPQPKVEDAVKHHVSKDAITTARNLTNTEAARLLRFSSDFQKMNRNWGWLFIATGLYTGLRQNEILSLKWSDLISPTGIPKDRAYVRISKQKKGKKTMEFPISGEYGYIIRETYRVAMSEGWGDTNSLIFSGAKSPDKALDASAVHRMFERAVALSGINSNFVSTHSLRKTAARHIQAQAEQMVNSPPQSGALKVISAYLQHTNIATTYRYIDREQEVIDKCILKITYRETDFLKPKRIKR